MTNQLEITLVWVDTESNIQLVRDRLESRIETRFKVRSTLPLVLHGTPAIGEQMPFSQIELFFSEVPGGQRCTVNITGAKATGSEMMEILSRDFLQDLFVDVKATVLVAGPVAVAGRLDGYFAECLGFGRIEGMLLLNSRLGLRLMKMESFTVPSHFAIDKWTFGEDNLGLLWPGWWGHPKTQNMIGQQPWELISSSIPILDLITEQDLSFFVFPKSCKALSVAMMLERLNNEQLLVSRPTVANMDSECYACFALDTFLTSGGDLGLLQWQTQLFSHLLLKAPTDLIRWQNAALLSLALENVAFLKIDNFSFRLDLESSDEWIQKCTLSQFTLGNRTGKLEKETLLDFATFMLTIFGDGLLVGSWEMDPNYDWERDKLSGFHVVPIAIEMKNGVLEILKLDV